MTQVIQHTRKEVKGMLKVRLNPKALNMAIDGLIRKKQVEAEGPKLKLPGFKPAVGKDQELYKDKIVEAIKKGGSQPPVREELPALLASRTGTRRTSCGCLPMRAVWCASMTRSILTRPCWTRSRRT